MLASPGKVCKTFVLHVYMKRNKGVLFISVSSVSFQNLTLSALFYRNFGGGVRAFSFFAHTFKLNYLNNQLAARKQLSIFLKQDST